MRASTIKRSLGAELTHKIKEVGLPRISESLANMRRLRHYDACANLFPARLVPSALGRRWRHRLRTIEKPRSHWLR